MASLLQMDIMDIKNLFLKKNISNKNTDNSNSKNILLKIEEWFTSSSLIWFYNHKQSLSLITVDRMRM